MAGSRAKTPHGIALDRFLLEKGPTSKAALLDHVAKHVPVGLAVNTVYRDRVAARRNTGNALGVPGDQVADKYATRQADPVASGARKVASHTLWIRLDRGTVFVNADGLLQHRDWRPGGAS